VIVLRRSWSPIRYKSDKALVQRSWKISHSVMMPDPLLPRMRRISSGGRWFDAAVPEQVDLAALDGGAPRRIYSPITAMGPLTRFCPAPRNSPTLRLQNFVAPLGMSKENDRCSSRPAACLPAGEEFLHPSRLRTERNGNCPPLSFLEVRRRFRAQPSPPKASWNGDDQPRPRAPMPGKATIHHFSAGYQIVCCRSGSGCRARGMVVPVCRPRRGNDQMSPR